MEKDVKFKGVPITVEDRRFTKNFGKELGSFTLEIPLPFEKVSIMAATSRVAGGDINAIAPEEREYTRMVVTLNTVIKEHPPWWEGADTCPDDDFLNKLWRWYLGCENEFTARLKSKTQGKVLEKPE